jgi:hypothetical protein
MAERKRIHYVEVMPEGYELALGKFVVAFAKAEAQLFLFAEALFKWSRADAQLFLSSDRVHDLTGKIRKYYKSHNLPLPEGGFVDETLNQLATINQIRDDLVHYGLALEFGTGPVATPALRKPNARVAAISNDILGQMTDDLLAIVDRLFTFSMYPDPEAVQDSIVYPKLHAPWRYTRRAPGNANPKKSGGGR